MLYMLAVMCMYLRLLHLIFILLAVISRTRESFAGITIFVLSYHVVETHNETHKHALINGKTVKTIWTKQTLYICVCSLFHQFCPLLENFSFLFKF